jgi:RimJ/RimL family protein N-acetyltransferase
MGARTTLTDAWPLFGLRIRSEHLVLRLPTDDDVLVLLDLAKSGIHDADEMPFGVAWSVLPSPAFERGYVQHHWRGRADWTPAAWGLHLMVELDGKPVGAQSLNATDFAILRTVDTGSWLGRDFQGRGLGKEMRAAVLGFAFDGLRAQVATSGAFLDNAASNAVSRSLGYAEDGRASLAPQGVAREVQRFRMTLAGWRARPRAPVTIEGLEACRELFGA